jgi:serralysin
MRMTGTSSVAKTSNNYINGLLYGVKWAGPITFSFTDAASDYETGYANGEPLANFAPVSTADMQAMRAILLGTSKAGAGAAVGMQGMGVAQFTLLQTSDAGSNGADIRIGQSSKPSTAYAYTPGLDAGGDVWLGTAYAGTSNDYRNPILGNYAHLTLAHELGHALGLKHAQEAGGVANTAVPADRDDLEFTIMSYRAYIGASTTAGYGFEQFGAPQSFMMLDIAALQQMYGANYGYRATDTTYRWNALTGELSVDGIGQGQPGANRIFETLWDGGGRDTFDLSNYGGGVTVDLTPGGWSTLSVTQLSYLGAGHYARANVFNAMLFNGDLRSLIEDAIGGTGNDTLTGNQGDNHLWGGGGNDSLVGGAGADTLEGGAGTNTMLGGLGDDTYIICSAGDVVREDAGAGFDRVIATVSQVLAANVEELVLAGSDAINGTGNALTNRLTGNAAANRLDGGGGADTLAGGGGDDTYIVGATGVLVVEAVNAGTDVVQASVSYVLTDNVENLILTGTGALNGTGNALANILSGNAGANLLFGGAGNDWLIGNAGNDTLDGGIGSNTLEGGQGNDTYIVSSATDLLREDAGAGIDSVQAGVGFTLSNNIEMLVLTGTGNIDGSGNALANSLTGNAGANRLSGGEGNDTLLGNAGDDTLDGGTGADGMTGGLGNDCYVVDALGDVVVEAAGAGTDLVLSSIALTLGANLENLTLTGVGALNGTGNALANLLTGNAGSNLLNGGDGADTLAGGGGDDTLCGGMGTDVLTGGVGCDIFRFASRLEGQDRITDFTSGIDHLEFSAAGFGGGLVAGINLLTTGHLSINATGTAVGLLAQFVYSTVSHLLSWDSNGATAGGALVLAQLQDGSSLVASDFQVIA